MKNGIEAFLRIKKYIALSFAIIFILCSLFSCSSDDSKTEDDTAHVLAYEGVDVTQSVRLCQYKGLTVEKKAGESDAEAIWRVIGEGCEILQYPEAQISYYLEQSRQRCEYYATVNDVDYESAMAALGVTEESMLLDAKSLVADDMIGIALRTDAGIELTEDEKDRLFDKYAEKYAYDWGYNLAYVEKNLREQVYESMRYDKTTEYLVRNNTFVEPSEA